MHEIFRLLDREMARSRFNLWDGPSRKTVLIRSKRLPSSGGLQPHAPKRRWIPDQVRDDGRRRGGGAVIGFIIAGFCLLLIAGTLATGRIGANWPMKPIDREESPGEFWTIITVWLFAAAAGIGYGLRMWIWGS